MTWYKTGDVYHWALIEDGYVIANVYSTDQLSFKAQIWPLGTKEPLRLTGTYVSSYSAREAVMNAL